jgi:hypothetical protein
MNYLKSLKRIIRVFLILLFCTALSFAQNKVESVDTSTVKIEEFNMQKSAWGAVARSAILPGWGQFYNESYWKIPIVWGAIGYLGYNWVDRHKLFKNYRDLYNQQFELNNTNNETYQELREFYRDQRDLLAVFIGLAYFLNLVDAFVDAHLFDFDVSEDIRTNSAMINIKYSF